MPRQFVRTLLVIVSSLIVLLSVVVIRPIVPSIAAMPSRIDAKTLKGVSPTPTQTCGKWSVVPSPTFASGAELNDIAEISDRNIWAVGTSNSQPLIEHWDGKSWNIISTSGSGTLLKIVAFSERDIWATGSITEHWDGKNWSLVSIPNFSLAKLSEVSAHNIWAIGSLVANNQQNRSVIEHWNGKSWSVVTSPNNGYPLSNIVAISSHNVWVWSTSESTITEHWDGKSWSIVSNPNSLFELTALARVPYTDQFWALGTTTSASVSGQPYAEHWNGSSWDYNQAINSGAWNYISSAAASVNNVWAVGSLQYGDHHIFSSAIAIHWNGTQWDNCGIYGFGISTLPGSHETQEHLNGITLIRGTSRAWAVGQYRDWKSDTLQPFIAYYS